MLLNFSNVLRRLIALREEEGQDLVEYALIVALIALAAVAGMSVLANNINAAFTSVGSKLSSYVS